MNNGSHPHDSSDNADNVTADRKPARFLPFTRVRRQPDADTRPAPAPIAPETRDATFANDIKTRRRNARGDREPSSYAFSVPPVPDVPLDKTPLAAAIAVIAAQQPGLAATLHHFYDYKLRNALRRFVCVRAEEEASLADTQTQNAQHNADTDIEQERLRAERDQTVPDIRADLRALDPTLGVAHQDAAAKAALAGGAYDAAHPSEDCVLRHAPRPLETFAAHLKLPWTPADPASQMSRALSSLAIVGIGAMMGLSLGFVSGLLHADTPLDRELPSLLMCLLIGCVLALGLHYGVKHSFRAPAQRYYLGQAVTAWLPFTVLAFALGIAMIALEANLEREGIVQLIQIHAGTSGLSGHTAQSKDFAYLLIALIISVPYVTYVAWTGYLCGRSAAVMHRLTLAQHDDYEQTDAARRADPVVQTALCAIAYVKDLLNRQSELQQRVTQAEAPYEQRIAALEARRLPVPTELSEKAQLRVQDAFDNFNAAQEVFDARFEQALSRCEPSLSMWQRLWAALFGPCPPRGGSHDRRRPAR